MRGVLRQRCIAIWRGLLNFARLLCPSMSAFEMPNRLHMMRLIASTLLTTIENGSCTIGSP